MLHGKRILIGVTGSIAAYKIAVLTRLLIKAGAHVQIIMTEDAEAFIGKLTLSTLSKNPVLTDFVKNEEGEWNNHVDLGISHDLMIIAPASANTMAKAAHGLSDNLLLVTYLSARCPVMFAPAMDLDMYQHPSVQKNINTLISYGNHIIQPGSGELASGLIGQGRMAEPEEIFEQIRQFFVPRSLANKKVLVTAGPTYEPIDPVRFIGNHSSGKMGIAVADELADRGADVYLVCGPSSVKHRNQSINRIDVRSANEMFDSASNLWNSCDAGILSAAVADFTPTEIAPHKIKKTHTTPTIELKATTDILASLGANKRKGQILAGFALETQNELEYARQKVDKKNLDFIVMNSLRDEGAGFATDTNKITIIDNKYTTKSFELKSKSEVAQDIVDQLEQAWQSES